MGREGYHSALPLARTQAGGRGANLKGTTMRVVYSGVLAAVFSMSAAAAGDGAAPTTAGTFAMNDNALKADNPFAGPSTLPYELPPFDRIHDGDYLPAFHAACASSSRRSSASPTIASRPPSRTPSSRSSAPGSCCAGWTPRSGGSMPATRTRSCRTSIPRWRPSSPRRRTPFISIRRCGRASKRSTTSARERTSIPSRSSCSRATTPNSCAPAHVSSPPTRRACAP